MAEEQPVDELEEVSEILQEQEEARYFYSTHTPHAWSSGPTVHYYWDAPDGFREVRSLEEAREAALRARSGVMGSESMVVTEYGVTYRTRHDGPGPRGKRS